MRVKRGVARHRRHKKILKKASGFRGSRGKLIRPARGAIKPEIVRSVVVLPAPLLPMSVTISPSSTCSETPWSALILP